MIKDLIIKCIKQPRKITSYLRTIFILCTRKRVSFTHEDVVTGFGVNGATKLPHFSFRLYNEVKLLNKAIGSYHAKRSLEIGCGYGRLTPWISEHSNKHYAIDPESDLLNDAKKFYPNIYFYNAKAQKLPFPNEYFDLCVSWTVLQHIPPKELTKAISEIKRVCTSKAIIILAERVGNSRCYQEYVSEKWKDIFLVRRTWSRTLEKWKAVFYPYKLTWSKERKIGESSDINVGLVMRFEGTGYENKEYR